MSSLNPGGTPFIELLTVDSTNNYAMGLVRAGMAQHGTAVFAHEQTQGKGQRNKQWASEKNQNIALSIIIEPNRLNYPSLFSMSMAVATGLYHFVSVYVKEELKIKWPNDLYWRDRKAAGVLIENRWQGSEWKFAVAGVGINVNQTNFGSLASKPVSLKEICGKSFDPLLLAKEAFVVISEQLSVAASEPQKIISEYREHLYKLHQPIKLKKSGRVFEAIVKDVSIDGKLVVEHGIEESFDVGEVEWVI